MYLSINLDIEIAPATPAHYAHLAQFHYRAGPPATAERILRATHRGAKGEQTLAVLIVSRPTLNARWRQSLWPNSLWPGLLSDPAPAARARLLNHNLRTISRVIVDPRDRGLGIAASLVRAYLDDPITPHTEAVAAMGGFCGFFRAAGMREVVVQPSRRDQQLRIALRTAGLQPWCLVDSDRVLRLPRCTRKPLEAALRRWANDSRATRQVAEGELVTIIDAAARTVANPFPVRAYGHDAEPGNQQRMCTDCTSAVFARII